MIFQFVEQHIVYHKQITIRRASNSIFYIAAVHLIGSAVFLICNSKMQKENISFGWSFYLNTVGSSMSLVTGIIFTAQILLVSKGMCCRWRENPRVILCYTTDKWDDGNEHITSDLECVWRTHVFINLFVLCDIYEWNYHVNDICEIYTWN